MDNSFLAAETYSANDPADEERPIGIGVVGLGAFGRFCLEAYIDMPGAQVVAIADSDPAALAAGASLAPHALRCDDAGLLMALPEVELVALCTPPDRHLALVLAAALAGKHIVCDKPLGVSLAEFDTAVMAAAAHRVMLGINLVLRHSPLYHAVERLSSTGALGNIRRLVVENYADEARGFSADHWLWRPERSGGLSLAADIHWFDLATRLLGPAYEVQAWEPGAGTEIGPRRLSTTVHAKGAVASIYHAFDTMPGATGCTVLVSFDEGEVRIEGWVPARLTVTCRADCVTAVAAILSGSSLPQVTNDDDGRVTLTVCVQDDRRSDYLDMIRTTVRLVLEQMQGQGNEENTGIAAARAATATALAAEAAAETRGWVQINNEGPLEAAG